MEDKAQEMAKNWSELLDTSETGFTRGECFENTGRFVMDKSELDGSPILLCHGLVWHPEKKLYHPHAWLEWGDGAGMVIDPSTGQDEALISFLPFYYEKARIEPEKIKRYTADEYRKAIIKTGNWGPWEE